MTSIRACVMLISLSLFQSVYAEDYALINRAQEDYERLDELVKNAWRKLKSDRATLDKLLQSGKETARQKPLALVELEKEYSEFQNVLEMLRGDLLTMLADDKLDQYRMEVRALKLKVDMERKRTSPGLVNRTLVSLTKKFNDAESRVNAYESKLVNEHSDYLFLQAQLEQIKNRLFEARAAWMAAGENAALSKDSYQHRVTRARAAIATSLKEHQLALQQRKQAKRVLKETADLVEASKNGNARVGKKNNRKKGRLDLESDQGKRYR